MERATKDPAHPVDARRGGRIRWLCILELHRRKDRSDRANELTSLNSDPIPAGESINFLIVGVDDRSTIPDDWEDKFGDFAGRRTDVLMIAHIANSGIQLLSIP